MQKTRLLSSPHASQQLTLLRHAPSREPPARKRPLTRNKKKDLLLRIGVSLARLKWSLYDLPTDTTLLLPCSNSREGPLISERRNLIGRL